MLGRDGLNELGPSVGYGDVLIVHAAQLLERVLGALLIEQTL
jgi:hypothetical protein